jgi:hypothetical protein
MGFGGWLHRINNIGIGKQRNMMITKIIAQGECAIVWNRQGAARIVHGPKRLFLVNATVQALTRYAAEPDAYLVIKYLNGKTEHLPGPVALWKNPLEHLSVDLRQATKVDANEALVVYRNADHSVTRRVVRGPSLFICTPDEWIHHFSWHGSDPKHGGRKSPSVLQFDKLRVIPDQMYFDVESVRTRDDALLAIKLMVFFELVDIEKMLDQTHDPVADFINALSADAIDFVGGLDFDSFKEQTDALNQLGTYSQLIQRAERIGYRINKVVYRGYYASDKLQSMHDNAIECRTKLRLESETERQSQELADLKLVREAERAVRRQEMNEAEVRHQNRIADLAHAAKLSHQEAEQRQALEQKREEDGWTLEATRLNNKSVLLHDQATHEEQLRFFAGMQGLGVDLTRYLIAQYQNPDKVIRIDQNQESQLHLHERY